MAQENERELPPAQSRAPLGEYELADTGRPPYLLTMTEFKLLGIAGVGFFLDGMLLPFTIMHQKNLT